MIFLRWSVFFGIFIMFSSLLSGQSFISQTTEGEVSFSVGVLAEGISIPWDIEQVDDGRIFVLERSGMIYILDVEEKALKAYHQIKSLYAQGQGGLFDMLADPFFESTSFLYITYTARSQGKIVTRLSRFVDTKEGLVNEKILYEADPSGRAKHFGGRLALSREGYLFMSLGERGELDKAQNRDSLHGSILRLQRDGRIVPDNPFLSMAGALGEIYSYGHRNPQGLAIHPQTGQLYSSEHGPSGYDRPGGGDEINLIQKGGNYGWPVIHHDLKRRAMINPIIHFTPATAPGDAAFYSHPSIPEWQNNLFVPNLRGESLQRFELEGSELVQYETLLEGYYGRLRSIEMLFDGSILVGTSNDYPNQEKKDRILIIKGNDLP